MLFYDLCDVCVIAARGDFKEKLYCVICLNNCHFPQLTRGCYRNRGSSRASYQEYYTLIPPQSGVHMFPQKLCRYSHAAPPSVVLMVLRIHAVLEVN